MLFMYQVGSVFAFYIKCNGVSSTCFLAFVRIIYHMLILLLPSVSQYEFHEIKAEYEIDDGLYFKS